MSIPKRYEPNSDEKQRITPFKKNKYKKYLAVSLSQCLQFSKIPMPKIIEK